MEGKTQDLLKYIELGTDYKEWFNYDGQPLPIRPLSSYELDQALLKALQEGISQNTFRSVVMAKLKLYDTNTKIDLDIENYQHFVNYFNEIDYWVVFFGMKDFQPEKFSQPDYNGEFENDFDDWIDNKEKGYYIVRKMKYVHKIAEDIINMTDQPVVKLVEVISNTKGKVLASCVHAFHQPLSSEAWKLTPLQQKFILYSSPNSPKLLKSEEDLPGFKQGRLIDIINQFKKMGFDV
ncbi:MAG: hypothetical protein FK731_08830 [Asgard group archaeon]|nr:hypothetical protein [Asgard group archaeon]